MAYPISATKLRNYQRCAYSYYLRYEKQVSQPTGFGFSSVGKALSQTLAKCHRDWHYHAARPDRRWFHRTWIEHSQHLTESQAREGRSMIDTYYDQFIQSESALRRPFAVEGRINASIQVGKVEFQIMGRFDRIDELPDGLELIDYKAAKSVTLLSQSEMDLQLGLYALAFAQTYEQRLQYVSLLLLRTGEKIRYPVRQKHYGLAKRSMSTLAGNLQATTAWEANPGEHCTECTFSRYCSAVSREPSPLPKTAQNRGLQLAFPFSA
jgi:putative RecB family exonuclease